MILDLTSTPDNVAQVDNPKLLKNVYGFVIIAAAVGLSSKQNEMITFDVELVTPETIQTQSGAVKVAGLKMKSYLSLTDKSIPQIKSRFAMFGIPLPPVLDTGNLDVSGFVGKGFRAWAESEEITRKMEQYNPATGQTDQVTYINEETGHPEISWRPKLGFITKADPFLNRLIG